MNIESTVYCVLDNYHQLSCTQVYFLCKHTNLDYFKLNFFRLQTQRFTRYFELSKYYWVNYSYCTFKSYEIFTYLGFI